jgi:hypothetical protein
MWKLHPEGTGIQRNAPYPYSSVGLLPSSLMPFLYVMNMGTWVPSLLGTNTCRTQGSTQHSRRAQRDQRQKHYAGKTGHLCAIPTRY